MQDFTNKKILLGICGGIAAYKSALLVRDLTRLGAVVRVVMTAAARQFITPLTLQALTGEAVRCDLFDQQSEHAMGHIELARWADYLLIAPATANCLAKMANGFADDLLSTIYLVAACPVIICPAMNRNMWMHAATQNNCQTLIERGVVIVGPEEGAQACGEFGFGRMSEVEAIINALRLQQVNRLLFGEKVLITAGPTKESIDPVRYISNHSSGKMGYALAQAALMAGAQVTLVSGPCSLPIPSGVIFHPVENAQDMFDTVMSNLQEEMIVIACAAVADYSIEKPSLTKIKKKDHTTLHLSLIPNPDILAHVVASGKAKYVVGFAAETDHVLEHALEKLSRKKVNMVIANHVGAGIGFANDYNQVTVLTEKERIDLSLNNKVTLAGELIALLAKKVQNDIP
ncbi:MAG: bifunctional phosphopantothenoylcysteine decarboxylase/phosphopantothenate--cysteine ligase CoaBC [Legionella sp.]